MEIPEHIQLFEKKATWALIYIIVLTGMTAVAFTVYAIQQDREQVVTASDAFYVVFALLIGTMAGMNLSKFILFKSLQQVGPTNQK
jgi:hypothetical protein